MLNFQLDDSWQQNLQPSENIRKMLGNHQWPLEFWKSGGFGLWIGTIETSGEKPYQLQGHEGP